MAENDILGISATADFSDAFAKIEKFCNMLASIGAISSDTSKRLQQSFAEIGTASTNELGAKTTAALHELDNALDETKKKVEKMPSDIQAADDKVEQARKTIEKLEAELSKLQDKQTKTPIASKQFQEISKQVDGVQLQLRNNRNALTLAETEASKLRVQYAKAQEALLSLQKMQESGKSAAGGAFSNTISDIGATAAKSATEINRMGTAFEQTSSKAANTAESTSKVGEAASGAQKEVDGLKEVFDKLEKAGAAVGTGFSVKELGSKILNVRGEFQQLEVAFRTMIGNEKQAKDLFEQLVHTAAVTPFGLTDIANGAKQLLAFGLEADKVNDTLVRLGDIAAGLSIPLGDLIYLYGTTMTQGTLYTEDLRQFMGRGIPLADELAKQFGVTKDAVSELVTEGKVGFPDVQKAIENLTNEGGKFGGLMDAQSHTITGQISNIEDALDGMFNDIGKSSEGVINTGLGIVSSLIENWRTVGKVLTDVVIVYGTYKAAVIACNAIRAVENGITEQAAVLKALDATATANLSRAELIAAARKQWLAGITKSFIATIKAETAALLSNPYAIAAAALVGFGLVMYNVIKNQKEFVSQTEQVQKAHNKMASEIKAQNGEIEASVNHSTASAITKIEQLKNTIHDNNKTLKERKEAINELKKIVPSYHAQISKAGKLFNENSVAINNYVKNLQKAARAEAAYSKMVENQRKILDLEDTRDDARQKQRNVNNAAQRRGLKSGERVESRTRVVGTSSYGATQTSTSYVIIGKDGKERPISNEQASKLMQDANWGQMFDTRAQIANDGIKQLQQQNDKLQRTIEANGGVPKQTTPTAATTTTKDKSKNGHSGNGSNDNYDPLQNAYETSKAKHEYEQYRQELANKLYDSVTSNSIEMLADEGEQQRKQIEHNRTKDIAELDKMIEELAKRKQALDKQEWLKGGKGRKEYQYANTANGKRTLQSYIGEVNQGSTLKAYNASKESINAKYDAQLQAMLQKEQEEQEDALNAFYSKYGTAQQKEDALRKQFASKIAKAKTVGEAKSLQKELQTALSELWTQTFEDSINWEEVFSNLNDLSKEQLTDLRDKITAYIKTDKFKKATPQNQKVVIEALGEINSQLIDNGGIFANLAQTTKDYKTALSEYKQAQAELADALKELETATVSGDIDKINAANEKVTAARNNVKDKKSNVTQTQQAQDKAEKKTIDNVLTLSSAITKLGESSEMSLGEIGSVAEQVTNAFSKAGSKIGGIIGAIFSLLDALQKQGFDGFIKNLFSSVFGAVGGIFRTLTGSSLFGSNEKSIDKIISNLTTSNQNLENAINSLTKTMEEAAAQDATNIYNRTKADVEEEMNNTQQMMQNASRAYSNGFLGIGGKHSSAKHINEAMSADDWTRISSIVGQTVSSAQDFFNLSSEQMAKVATNATDLYTKIQNAAKDGKEDVSSYMDSYIKYYQQLIDLQNTYNETLTGISFDNLKDDLKSLLTDTETTMSDVSKKVADYMRNSIAKNIINSTLMKQAMQKWYDDFAKYSGDNNGLTESEANELQKRYNDIYTQLNQQYKNALKAAGIEEASSEEQSATAKGVSSITYDQANLLANLATARNIALEKILAANSDILGIMRNGSTSSTPITHILNREESNSSLSVDYSTYLTSMTFDIGNIKEFSRTMSSDISVMRDIQEQGLN